MPYAIDTDSLQSKATSKREEEKFFTQSKEGCNMVIINRGFGNSEILNAVDKTECIERLQTEIITFQFIFFKKTLCAFSDL